MPLQRIGNGLEVGVGKDLLEVLEVGFDFRVFSTWQWRFEARVFHQLPSWQVDAPGFGQAGLVAVLVSQLLEERALGRHVGGHFQGAIGQGVTGFRVVAGTGPGQFVIGVVADQPWIVAMIAGRDGHGAFGGHGEPRIEWVGHGPHQLVPVLILA